MPTRSRRQWKLYILTHTDLDGVAAASIYLRLTGYRLGVDAALQFTEPHKLHKVVSKLEPGVAERIVISDLGPNSSTISETVEALHRHVEAGTRVEWYDHHRWEEEWIRELSEIGVRVHVDTSTCAAGVVAKYAPDEVGAEVDEVIETLAAATCAADLWRWDHPLAPKLYRVAERYRGRRGDEWKRMLVRGFSSGSLWWPELEDALQEYLRLEFEGYEYTLKHVLVKSVDGCRFAVALKKPGPPSPSIVGHGLIDRLGVDFVVIVRTGGSRGLSFRSGTVNVRELAKALGGGGHPRAAGAPLEAPLPLRLLFRLAPSIKLRYAARRVEEAVRRLGGCPRLE